EALARWDRLPMLPPADKPQASGDDGERQKNARDDSAAAQQGQERPRPGIRQDDPVAGCKLPPQHLRYPSLCQFPNVPLTRPARSASFMSRTAYPWAGSGATEQPGEQPGSSREAIEALRLRRLDHLRNAVIFLIMVNVDGSRVTTGERLADCLNQLTGAGEPI